MQRRAWIATGSVALGLGVLALAGGGLTGWAGGDPLGCTIDAGAKENGVVPIHAECSWPDRSPERVEQVLAELERHADVFGSLGASPVLERADGYALQGQVHVAPGIADREIMVEWQVDPPGEDGRRYAWSIAGDQSQRLQGGTAGPRGRVGSARGRSRCTGHLQHAVFAWGQCPILPGALVPGIGRAGRVAVPASCDRLSARGKGIPRRGPS